MTKILKTIKSEGGGGKAYRAMVIGSSGFLYWIRYELCMLFFRNLSGVLGYAARRVFYKGLFGACGRGAIIGTGVTLRNPRKIILGDSVVLDDNSVLDAKGDTCEGIHIGNDVFISRDSILNCKNGGIYIGSNVSIGPGTIISVIDSGIVRVGNHNVIAPHCSLVSAGDYLHDRTDVPMAEQGLAEARGVTLDDDVWLATLVVVSDGSRIGRGSIIGCQSMVRGEIPPYSIAYGVPARVARNRINKLEVKT